MTQTLHIITVFIGAITVIAAIVLAGVAAAASAGEARADAITRRDD